MEALGWEYLKEKLTIDLTDDLRAAIDPAPFGRHALEEDRGCFTSRGYLYPSGDEWQHDRSRGDGRTGTTTTTRRTVGGERRRRERERKRKERNGTATRRTTTTDDDDDVRSTRTSYVLLRT